MKTIIILLLLTTFYTFAQTFDVNISLTTHNNSEFGEWKLTKVSPNSLDSIFRGKIIRLDSRVAPFYIESSDIEIFDKELYVNHFLKQGYYTLQWIAKKGTLGDEIWEVSSATKTFLKESDFYKSYEAQEGWEEIDWSMVLADYINSTIATLPTYNLEISNRSQKPIKVIEFYTKTLYTTGGEASPGGAYFPTVNKLNFLSLHWNKKNSLKLIKLVIIQAQKSARIPLSIFVEKGAQGDGPGQLTVALFIKYREEGKVKEELLTILNQSEDYGYLTGW
ncbi:hypothetical protein KKC13_06035 [bacterium]|nr:hypothetical protein [bacterium]MBU1958486.1 hypothetical protein [bacterium]